jgi:NAD(P)-dependent dehydrogenase (short-subunit alcohol dehydrogenase family)
MSLELTGKIALVTGALRGIGKGIALVLAEKGADIILNDKTEDAESDDLVNQIKAMGRHVLLIKADVTKKNEVKKMFETIEQKFGRLDILVNNAGTSQNKNIFEMELEDWQYIIDTNLTSAFLCSKEAMRIMRTQGSGRIISISSVVAERGAILGHVHYAATKSGILGMTKTLARTGAPYGITVNAVAPGIIETELLFKTHGVEGVEKLSASVPLGLGTPRHVGLAVAFLCSEGGDYLTGTTIDVNGGFNMR